MERILICEVSRIGCTFRGGVPTRCLVFAGLYWGMHVHGSYPMKPYEIKIFWAYGKLETTLNCTP